MAKELLKPNTLKDGFGENGGRLLPKDIFPDPTAIGESHGYRTEK